MHVVASNRKGEILEAANALSARSADWKLLDAKLALTSRASRKVVGTGSYCRFRSDTWARCEPGRLTPVCDVRLCDPARPGDSATQNLQSHDLSL